MYTPFLPSYPNAAALNDTTTTLHRALPLLLSPSDASPELIDSWHRSVLSSAASSSSAPVLPSVVFLCSVCLFASLLFAFHRCGVRWRKDSHFGRLWSQWSALQRIEWISYAVSTVHAVIACVAGLAAIAHSVRALYHAQPQSTTEGGLWAATDWFIRTSLRRLLPASSASSSSSLSPSAESAFSLALSCAFSESVLRDCALLVTSGYLLVDLVLCLASTAVSQSPSQSHSSASSASSGGRQHHIQLANPLTLLHHTVILLAFAWGVRTHTGTLYMCWLLINEVSTCFLNGNFALSSLQLSTVYPRLYVCNAVLLLVLFVTFRVLLNCALLCHLFLFSWLELQPLWRAGSVWLMPPAVQLRCAALSALCLGHVSINAIWAFQLVRAVHRKWSKAEAIREGSGHSNAKSKQL